MGVNNPPTSDTRIQEPQSVAVLMVQYNVSVTDFDNFVVQVLEEIPEPEDDFEGMPEPLRQVERRLRTRIRAFAKAVSERKPDALKTYIRCHRLLQGFFVGFPEIHSYHFLRLQVLSHPARRKAIVQQVLLISEAPNSQSASEPFEYMREKLQQWNDRVFNAERILEDPPFMPAYIFNASLQEVPHKVPGMDQSCTICEDTYVFGDLASPHRARRTLCQHHFCAECLRSLRRKTGQGTYNCPMCRACLVCGNHDCNFHVVPAELVLPAPLHMFLEHCEDGPAPFFGMEPHMVRLLRELTRAARVTYQYSFQLSELPSISDVDRRTCQKCMDDVQFQIGLDIAEARKRTIPKEMT